MSYSISRETPIRIQRVRNEKMPFSAMATIRTMQKSARAWSIQRPVIPPEPYRRQCRGAPPSLLKRLGLVADAIENHAHDQRHEISDEAHGDERDQADRHPALIAAEVGQQAHELLPAGHASLGGSGF